MDTSGYNLYPGYIVSGVNAALGYLSGHDFNAHPVYFKSLTHFRSTQPPTLRGTGNEC